MLKFIENYNLDLKFKILYIFSNSKFIKIISFVHSPKITIYYLRLFYK